MSTSRRRLMLFSLGIAVFSARAADPVADAWEPVRRLVGNWSGTSTGQAGEGAVTRRYSWVLGNRYLQEINTSVYLPQEKNKKGERHEHWSMFSYDKGRKTIMLRQFHIEGFVNTFRSASPNDSLVFQSESFVESGRLRGPLNHTSLQSVSAVKPGGCKLRRAPERSIEVRVLSRVRLQGG